jgi:arylsulfatase A
MSTICCSSDLGYSSEFSRIPTPYIDQLVKSPGSLHFTQYYVHSLCTPSRASLMTGRYHVNTGLTNVLVPGTPVGLPHDIMTLPEALKEKAGYKTAMAGKWFVNIIRIQ